MNCPICGIELDEFDEPDEATRMFCCGCNIMVTITDITDREICEDDEDNAS